MADRLLFKPRHDTRCLELVGLGFLSLFAATLRLLLGLLFADSVGSPRKEAEAASNKVSSCARRGCFGISPAVAAHRIMSRIVGLAAMRAPRCPGRATSTDLLKQIPDWPALGEACSKLSSVNPEKSLSSDLCPLHPSSAARLCCVTIRSEGVVDSADAKALTEEDKFRLRILTKLHAFAHGPRGVCFCQELVCDTAESSHCDSECDISPNGCVDGG